MWNEYILTELFEFDCPQSRLNGLTSAVSSLDIPFGSKDFLMERESEAERVASPAGL